MGINRHINIQLHIHLLYFLSITIPLGVSKPINIFNTYALLLILKVVENDKVQLHQGDKPTLKDVVISSTWIVE